jgi:hypothetical protein
MKGDLMQLQSPEFERFLAAKKIVSDEFLSKGIRNDVIRMSRVSPEAAAARAGLHVHAVGIGPKVVGGQITDTIAIRVYVIQKLGTEDGLRQEDNIPSEVNGIPTDVIEAPPAFLFQEEDSPLERLDLSQPAAVDCTSLRKKQQPTVIGGISTSREGGSPGTIACLCRSTRPDETGQIFVLSNSHIFGPAGGGNDHLLQPASQDAIPPYRRFAEFSRATTINLGGAAANDIDAGIGRLLDINHGQQVCSIGAITGTALATSGMQVRKHGRTTGLRLGAVDDIHCDIACGLRPVGAPVTALFRGQFRILKASSEPFFALNGDSGSLIVDRFSQNAVGLLFASAPDGSYGVANYIGDVLTALDITLP